MAYDANNRHRDCIAVYQQLEKQHPCISIRRQASELRYILEAPKLKISKDEIVTIPLIGSSYDRFVFLWAVSLLLDFKFFTLTSLSICFSVVAHSFCCFSFSLACVHRTFHSHARYNGLKSGWSTLHKQLYGPLLSSNLPKQTKCLVGFMLLTIFFSSISKFCVRFYAVYHIFLAYFYTCIQVRRFNTI